MNGRIRAISSHRVDALTRPWQACATPAGDVQTPRELDRATPDWLDATAPSTAAATLRALDQWSLDAPHRRFDADDWWWRLRFAAPAGEADEQRLCFDGLATLAEVWLDGEPLLTSRNMFVGHRRTVQLHGDSELLIRFASLDAALAQRRPRPRWRAPMVEHQQLRWHRTTLLGRTPGWSPPAAAVGPWRPIYVESARGVDVELSRLHARLSGDDGVVSIACQVVPLSPAARQSSPEVTLLVRRGGDEIARPLSRDGEREFAGELTVANAARWWPHTHGEPALYEARLQIAAGGEVIEVELGSLGFREIAVDRGGGGFSVSVNGAPVFCRGGCWTPLDPVSLDAGDDQVRAAMAQLRDAGMNMVRVGGTMVYESDAFLDAADRDGILLWQDFMFANMDYPADDPELAGTIGVEVDQQLARLAARPSLAVLCGNSEGEQQAAMWGASRSLWQPPLFAETLPARAAERCPDTAYVPSSAHGGAFPHTPDQGTCSYYGVGAYLRPLADARLSAVRFASECLAFANLPGDRAMGSLPGGHALRVHHAAYKERSPRDLGAGWDFDDVRDHYLAQLYRVDPPALRYADHGRYLELSRVASGEVMAATFGEWRRAASVCDGALVWFLRDLWPGAGWGVIGADGEPKPAYYYLRRALAPRAVHLSDEGCSGVWAHVSNDAAAELSAELSVALYRSAEIEVARARFPVVVPPRAARSLALLEHFDAFMDLSYAYRFGPPAGDLLVATLVDGETEIAEPAFFFPTGLPAGRVADTGLTADAIDAGDEDLVVTLRSPRFAQSVAIDAGGYRPDDNYFHLAPGGEKSVRLRRIAGEKIRRASAQPLNADRAAKIAKA